MRLLTAESCFSDDNILLLWVKKKDEPNVPVSNVQTIHKGCLHFYLFMGNHLVIIKRNIAVLFNLITVFKI